MTLAAIDRLGARIESCWRARDYASGAFPEIASELLAEADLAKRLSADDVISWCLGAASLPPQVDPLAKFGQPPLTLFRRPRFYIDALFWVDGTTSIHQHGFSGAFSVLVGSSIETLFSFEPQRTFDGHFVFGELQVRSTDLLRQGAVRPIEGGDRLIHSLFHLDRPSVSIVIRTNFDPGSPPQLRYSRAGIGNNPFFIDEVVDRKLQLVAMLRNSEHPAFEDVTGNLLASSDLHCAYRIIQECMGFGGVERLIDRVPDRRAAELFRTALKERRREKFIIGRRNLVSEPDLRFFLGVLLNASRRRDVLTLVGQRHPDTDPAGQVAAWLRRLSTVTMKLQAAGAAWEPNVLGLPDFDDALELGCANLLRSGSEQPADKVAAALDRLRALPALACLFND